MTDNVKVIDVEAQLRHFQYFCSDVSPNLIIYVNFQTLENFRQPSSTHFETVRNSLKKIISAWKIAPIDDENVEFLFSRQVSIYYSLHA